MTTNETLAANKAVVTDFFTAWSEGRFDRVGELLAPDGEWWVANDRSVRSSEFMLNRIKTVQGETEGGMRFRIDMLTAEDDRVAAVIAGEAAFPGREPYLQLYHVLARVADGRITRLDLYYDTALSNRVMRGEGGDGPLPSHTDD